MTLRIGVYGGTFDPVHLGHLVPVEETRVALGLDRILYVPAYHPPHKPASPSAPAHHRFAMLALALEPYPSLLLSDFEVARGGTTYTIETLRHLRAQREDAEILLVLGSDSLAQIETWRSFRELLAEFRLAVVEREGFGRAALAGSLPRTWRGASPPRARGRTGRPRALDLLGRQRSGYNFIHVVKARDPRGRKPQRKSPGERGGVPAKARPLPPPVKHPVPPIGDVDDLIAATLARASGPGSERMPRASDDAEVDARLTGYLKKGVAALLDKKAEKLVVLNLQGLTSMADYFVLATASSDRQAQALADAVEAALKAEGRRPLSIEGYSSPWILVDYGDVVFHIFHDEARRFYGLERLWGDAPDATASFR